MNLRTIALVAASAGAAAYAVHRWHQADKQRARAELEHTRAELQRVRGDMEAIFEPLENMPPAPPLTDREQAVLERIQRGESILDVTPFGSMGWVKVDQDER